MVCYLFEYAMPLSPQSSRATAPLRHRWTLRDGVAAAALFATTAAVVFWQNAHVAALWDIAYTLDSSMRFALGQMPYRDFPFVHPPLPFLIQAAIIRLTGRVFFHHVAYAALVGGLGTVLTWRIALDRLLGRLAHGWLIALLLAAPLAVLGLYCIIPHPSYDCDCAFSMLVVIWMLERLEVDGSTRSQPGDEWRTRWAFGFATGAAICLPLFFKQNMGLPFLLVALCVVGLVLGTKLSSQSGASPGERAALWAVLAGAGSTLAAAALLLHFTAGLGNYLHWTITFAGERRLPPWGDMMAIYRDPTLLWTLPCIVGGLLLLGSKSPAARWGQWRSAAAFALLAAPFAFALCSLVLYDDADERGDRLLALWPLLLIVAAALAVWNLVKMRGHVNLRGLMPILLLAAIHGTFLSQQLWGSTYAIWPMLTLLLAEMMAFLGGPFPPAHGAGKLEIPKPVSRWVPTTFTAFISATLLVCGAFYTTSEERLSYVDLPDGPVLHSAFPQLAGLSLAGPYLPEFDELLRYASAEIPFSDGLILLPGEDPFYFATGRVPQFPVLLFDPATDPYTPSEIAAMAQARKIRWLIVKRKLQMKVNPMPQREATLKLLQGQFKLRTRLSGYDIYRRP